MKKTTDLDKFTFLGEYLFELFCRLFSRCWWTVRIDHDLGYLKLFYRTYSDINKWISHEVDWSIIPVALLPSRKFSFFCLQVPFLSFNDLFDVVWNRFVLSSFWSRSQFVSTVKWSAENQARFSFGIKRTHDISQASDNYPNLCLIILLTMSYLVKLSNEETLDIDFLSQQTKK